MSADHPIAVTSRPARVLMLIVGVLCLLAGGALGWYAAVQSVGARGDAGASSDAAQAAKTAASQAATASEGWAHVANGAYALAKSENAAAQAARRQAREFAARAEKAAARANAAVAKANALVSQANAAAGKAAKDRAVAESARAVPVVPRAVPSARPQRRAVAAQAASAHDEGCRRATIYERTAASGSISRQAAYNAVMSGFAMNAHCAEPQHSLIEAYLLAQRASAESALHLGDWRSDLQRSDQLLAKCIERPEYRDTAGGCRTRLKKNQRIRQSAQPR